MKVWKCYGLSERLASSTMDTIVTMFEVVFIHSKSLVTLT